MRALLTLVIVLALASGPAWAQCTFTVGDGTNLSGSDLAYWIDFWGLDMGFGSNWTLCIAPGVYALDPADGWPLVLPAHAPEIVGADGAEATVLIGDGFIDAFVLENYAQGRFRDLTFRSFRTPVSGSIVASLEFTDSVVEYCTHGLSVEQDAAVVSGNTVRYNDVAGIGYTYYASVVGNHVHHNGGYGIAASFGGSIEYNLVEENGGVGISVYGVGQRVEHNVVRGNAVGVTVGEYISATINYNDLYSNEEYELTTWP
ncbi:MAG: right-handed parallel beta-helix repeat-containing protein, partial [Spirochaetaceae bacterium]|nr:right-handed parallel beta-helix repeat-containing protein [Spirochaetaceae bacterium]